MFPTVNRKLQIKPRKFETYIDENGEEKQRCTSVQLILKWGGSKLGVSAATLVSISHAFI